MITRKMADPWLEGCSVENIDSVKIPEQFEDNFEPSFKMPDSDEYLASLEARLARLKGKHREPTSKGMLDALQQARSDYLGHLVGSSGLRSQDAVSFLPEEGDENQPVAPSYIEKRLFPTKQALTLEELHHLLKADVLAQVTDSQAPDDKNGDISDLQR